MSFHVLLKPFINPFVNRTAVECIADNMFQNNNRSTVRHEQNSTSFVKQATREFLQKRETGREIYANMMLQTHKNQQSIDVDT